MLHGFVFTKPPRIVPNFCEPYLKEGVWAEQLDRDLNPFRRFRVAAAQCNGTILNWSKIARDVGVDDKTVPAYFNILEDTLVEFLLEPFQPAFRKRLSQKPKFYFFDTGVTCAINRTLNVPLMPGTFACGNIFEHFVLLEIFRLERYRQLDFRFSYLRTKDDIEISRYGYVVILP